MIMGKYGQELIIDLHDCDMTKFNREDIDFYFGTICKLTNMVQCERYFWDDIGIPKEDQQTDPHTKGTSAVQFILTSSIVIHTLELTGKAYINIFTCKDFEPEAVKTFTKEWFDGEIVNSIFIERI